MGLEETVALGLLFYDSLLVFLLLLSQPYLAQLGVVDQDELQEVKLLVLGTGLVQEFAAAIFLDLLAVDRFGLLLLDHIIHGHIVPLRLGRVEHGQAQHVLGDQPDGLAQVQELAQLLDADAVRVAVEATIFRRAEAGELDRNEDVQVLEEGEYVGLVVDEAITDRKYGDVGEDLDGSVHETVIDEHVFQDEFINGVTLDGLQHGGGDAAG